MNTAIQIKTHTSSSAKNKSLHNERKDESIKQPDFVILQKNYFHKFNFKEPIQAPKTTAKHQAKEKALKKDLATLQSKINTYNKRINEYQNRVKPNITRIDKLKEQVKELELQKSKIPELSDKRGKPQKIKYVEFELSLTNSNHLKHDKHIQNAFITALKELKKDEIFKDLKNVSEVMHLDQHSLHIHSLNKLVNGKSWNSIVESQKQATDKDGRDVYSRLQNKFNSLVRENLKELNLEIEPQQKGVKYTSLKKYKELTNFKSQDKERKKTLKQRLEEIKVKNIQPQPQQPQQNKERGKSPNLGKVLQKQKQQQQDFDFDDLAKKVENTKNKSNSSAFETQKKNEQFKETLKETQNEKEIEKSKSKKHSRSR